MRTKVSKVSTKVVRRMFESHLVFCREGKILRVRPDKIPRRSFPREFRAPSKVVSPPLHGAVWLCRKL